MINDYSLGLQVPANHYFTKEYLNDARFLGLQAQLAICLDFEQDKTYLEIGPGPGLLSTLLNHFQREIYTADPDINLRPNTVSKLPNLPFRSNSFNIVCAFEVLEHMPITHLHQNLHELERVSSEFVMISLPSQKHIATTSLSFSAIYKNKSISKTIFRIPLRKLTNPTEHYWELEHDNVSVDSVISVGQDVNLQIMKSYFVHPWFQFFIFRKNEHNSR